MKNYCNILEISRNANALSIKRAFRKLALEYHPDVNKNSHAHLKFIEITEAYEVLIDPIKRTEYDQLYDLFHSPKNTGIPETQYQDKQEKWQDFASQKANEYSEMEIDELMRHILDEVKFHGRPIARIGCLSYIFIFTGIVLLITIPMMYEDGVFDQDKGVLGMLIFIAVSAGIIWIGAKSINSEVVHYREKLKRRK